jgi:hypothetical protein
MMADGRYDLSEDYIDIEKDLKHFHSFCNAGIVLSHPGHKNKNVARVGHP